MGRDLGQALDKKGLPISSQVSIQLSTDTEANLFDFVNVPSFSSPPSEEAQFWKERALALKKYCKKLSRLLGESAHVHSSEEDEALDPIPNGNGAHHSPEKEEDTPPPTLPQSLTEVVVVEEEEAEADKSRNLFSDLEDEEELGSDGRESVNLQIGELIPVQEVEIEQEEEQGQEHEEEEESPPFSPTATVFIPPHSSNAEEEPEEEDPPPSPSPTVFIPRSKNKGNSDSDPSEEEEDSEPPKPCKTTLVKKRGAQRSLRVKTESGDSSVKPKSKESEPKSVEFLQDSHSETDFEPEDNPIAPAEESLPELVAEKSVAKRKSDKKAGSDTTKKEEDDDVTPSQPSFTDLDLDIDLTPAPVSPPESKPSPADPSPKAAPKSKRKTEAQLLLSSGSDSDFKPDLPRASKTKSVQPLDREKPSTSKKVVAEAERNKKKLVAKKERDQKSGRRAADSAARRGVLDSSSDDEEEGTSPKKVSKRTKFVSKGPITPEDIAADEKLSTKKPVVEVSRLAEEIETALRRHHFIKVEEDRENSSRKENDSDSSDSSIAKLDRAIRQLSTFNARITKRNSGGGEKGSKSSSPSKRQVKKKGGSDTGSSSEGALHPADSGGGTDGGDESGRPSIKFKSMKDILDSSYSDLEDLPDIPTKGEKDSDGKKSDKKDEDKGKDKKKLVTPHVRSAHSDDSDRKGDRAGVLGSSDEDDSDGEKKKEKKSRSSESSFKRKKGSSASDDEDSDALVLKRKTRSKKVKLQLTDDSSEDEDKKKSKPKKKGSSDDDSSVKITSSLNGSEGSEEDSDPDSDFVSKKKSPKKKRSKRGHSSDSDSSGAKKSKKKKKRKRIKEEKDSSDESGSSSKSGDDSDIETLAVIPASQRRKKINHILKDKDLKKSTRDAEKDEAERKRRVAEKQKLFNGVFENTPVADGKVTKLVLEIDPETKQPLIEVDESIVSKLKPHQADGIRFMYTTCFESVEQMKDGKGGGCILAHCMGLGKTLQTIAFTYTMLEHKKLTGMSSVLVVCPLNTVGNWLKECQHWLRDVPSKRMPPLHSLWDGKNVPERVDALKTWQRRGGIGIIHYDAFRVLVQDATGSSKAKTMKMKFAKDRDAVVSALLDPGPDIVVCDEGHLLKNNKSKLSLALSQVKTIRRIVLTGTPLQNNLNEYHTMVNFVKPNLLGSQKEFTNRFANPIKNGQCKDSSERDVKVMKRRAHVLHSKLDGCVQRLDYSVLTPYLPAKYEYCITIKLSDKQKALYRDYLANHVSTDPVERARRLLPTYAVLIKLIAHPVVLSMAKPASSDMEETDEEGSLKDFICDDEAERDSTTPAEADDSDSDIEELDDDGEKKKKAAPPPARRTRATAKDDPLEELPAGGEKAVFGREWWASHFEKKEDMYDTNLSGKLVILQEILKNCEEMEDRVLVFSQYLTSLDIIEEFLAEWDKEGEDNNKKTRSAPVTFPATVAAPSAGRWRSGTEYFRIDGATKTSDRQRSCDTFNKKTSSKAKLFLISTKAGGLGINLFGANRVVIFDASWNPSNDMQSIFRVYRFGQEKPCYIYRFVAQGTMEEKIYNRQVVKLSLSSRVIDEHQVERHFKFDDINEMYSYTPEDESGAELPTLAVPKDRLLANLLMSHKDWIISYFEHDTLLLNKEDETLTEEERKQAWEEYQNENERRIPVPNIHPSDQATYAKIMIRLRERFASANEDQIHASALIVLNKIQELRVLIQKLNYEGYSMAEGPRKGLEDKIKKIQTWISSALGGPLDGVNVPANLGPQFNPNYAVMNNNNGFGAYPQYQYGAGGPGILRGPTRAIPSNDMASAVQRQMEAFALNRMAGPSASAQLQQSRRRVVPTAAPFGMSNGMTVTPLATTREREMMQRQVQMPNPALQGLSLAQLQARARQQEQLQARARQQQIQQLQQALMRGGAGHPDDPVTLDDD